LSSSDFYSDITQSYLSTGPSNTGTSFKNWSAGNVYINKWYDQSGKLNDCSQNVLANQPTIQLYGNTYMAYFNNTTAASYLSINSPNTPYTVLSTFNNLTNTTYNTIMCATPTTDYGLRFYNSSVNGGALAANDWFVAQSGTKYS
jgi:hypothetical protein